MKNKKYYVYVISAMNSSIYDNETDRYYYHILARSDLQSRLLVNRIEKEAEKIFNKITTDKMIDEIDEREPWGKFIEEAKEKESKNGK